MSILLIKILQIKRPNNSKYSAQIAIQTFMTQLTSFWSP